MDPGYSNNAKRFKPDMTVKSEPMENMTTTSDYPVDMSMVSRDNGSESSHARYAPISVPHDLNARTFFQAAFYGQSILGHSPETFAQQQRFHSRLPDTQHKLQNVSPTPQHEQLQSQTLHKPHQVRSTHHTTSTPISPVSDHLNDELPAFKLKGSDGKLAIPEILASDRTGFSPTDLVSVSSHQRAKREFVPDEKKDNMYWNKRLKNNDSARRSRVKRKTLEKIMETRLVDLQKENIELRHEMEAIKRRFGITNESSGLSSKTSPSGRASKERTSSGDFSSSPPLSREYSRDEELESQSAGSDDSHSHDDSRSYNLGSVSALSHTLGMTGRDRADSFGSGTSSVGRSSRPDSRSSQPGLIDARTDKSGALDLSSDHSNRSTPARDSSTPESRYTHGQKIDNSPLVCDPDMEDKKNGQGMRGFPLKCRWKREMQSVANSSMKSTSNHD